MNKGLSPRAQKLLSVSSQNIAKKRGSNQLLPEHLLLAMISDADSLGFEIMLYLNINLLMLQLALEQAVPQGNVLGSNQEVPPSRRLRTILDIAAVESRISRKNYIGTEHLLLATLREENSVAFRFFSAIPISIDAVRQAAEAVSIRFRSSANVNNKEKEFC
jgi:ATP-dependent Clp protease ATP-binding subunit ClpC